MTKKEMQLQIMQFEHDGLIIKQQCAYGVPFQNHPQYEQWMTAISLFGKRHLTDHPLYNELNDAYFFRTNDQKGFSAMLGVLSAIGHDKEYWEEPMQQMINPIYNTLMGYPSMPQNQSIASPIAQQAQQLLQFQASSSFSTPTPTSALEKKVFIVHGHDNAAKQEMARTLEKAGFEAIILHEQADGGKTIIEKIEKFTDVSFAVVLYTECDYGRAKEDDVSQERFRARQNVVFEHGYLIGKLGRDHVCALVKGKVETPGDISGVVYTPMDAAGAWKMQLGKNMKAAGLEIDFNKLV